MAGPLRLALALGALAVTAGASAGARPQTQAAGASPPPEAAAPFAAPECLSCHDDDLIAQQRLSAAGWSREVDKMTRWGAPVPAERKDALVADLAARYGPGVAARPAMVNKRGEDVFSRACLVCHGADLVEQQRLTLAGWTREVAKMTAWGAAVSDAEKPVLAAYLSARFPADR